MIKQAILLCGGLGTRLRPYTYEMSKQMLPIAGHPLTEWNIAQFKKYGVTNFLINLYTKPDVMRGYLGDGSKWGVNITYNLEKEPPGTAGSIKQFEKYLDDEFFVIYGDMLSFIDYSKMEKTWREKPTDAIGMQRMEKTENYADADVAELDAQGKFVAIHPKPHTKEHPNAYRMRGAFIFRKKILSYIPKDRYYEIGRDLLQSVMAHGESVYAYECDEYSKAFDTVEKWREVENYVKKNNITIEHL
jgi:mannose-1-phosphate guanylyltransferase/phosphomannomutase